MKEIVIHPQKALIVVSTKCNQSLIFINKGSGHSAQFVVDTNNEYLLSQTFKIKQFPQEKTYERLSDACQIKCGNYVTTVKEVCEDGAWKLDISTKKNLTCTKETEKTK